MNKLKNTIRKGSAYLSFILFVYFGCLLDAPSWIPFLMCCITGSYLALYAHANNWFEGLVDEV